MPNQFTKAKAEGRTVTISSETREKFSKSSTGRTHTLEARKKISDHALSSTHRRLLRSTRQYVKLDGQIVLLDSSWEEALAKRLDELAIDWQRPTEALTWIDLTGKRRNYFPDFWLPKHGIYLDPKNSAAMSAQREKVDWLLKNRPDVKFLLTLSECISFRL
jgi:hypothetical protein